jgi:hypothetical protein
MERDDDEHVRCGSRNLMIDEGDLRCAFGEAQDIPTR